MTSTTSFAGSLRATTHVVQWGDADVWKVGGKVFAVAGWDDGSVLGITFKTLPNCANTWKVPIRSSFRP